MRTIILYIIVVLGLSASVYGFWYQQNELSDLRGQIRVLTHASLVLDDHADQLHDNQLAFNRILKRLNGNQKVLADALKDIIKVLNAHGSCL